MQRKAAKNSTVSNASHLKIGIVVSEYNTDITGSMHAAALDVLKTWQVRPENISTVTVPGSFEIPYGCTKLLKKGKFDAIIALGCIIKGETKHDEFIAHAVAQGIMRLTLDHQIPIAFGVVTTNTLAQARARSRGKHNKGAEAALAALRSALA